jgi:hypothetical protein
VRYVQEVYSIERGSPVPADEVIQVQLNNDSFTHDNCTYGPNKEGASGSFAADGFYIVIHLFRSPLFANKG